MNDLPTPTQGTNPSINKEQETGGIGAEVPFRPVGQETELSPEVASSGVKIRPTTIPISPAAAQLGVKAAGQNIPAVSPAVTLPLSDDQIAQGLKQSIWSSWRWLAQWCVRRLKQVHMGLKNIHGRLTRVRQ
ncbi:MAG: hypothetical protein NTY06_00235 [Candidatus Gottesmanbacteria bacterium]|nr:hypothetical protein [Candidatus Gottesmanbacteria bacterium]